MGWWRQRPEWRIYEPRTAGDCQSAPGARREDPTLRTLRTASLWAPGLQNPERRNLCYFKPPGLGELVTAASGD